METEADKKARLMATAKEKTYPASPFTHDETTAIMTGLSFIISQTTKVAIATPESEEFQFTTAAATAMLKIVDAMDAQLPKEEGFYTGIPAIMADLFERNGLMDLLKGREIDPIYEMVRGLRARTAPGSAARN